MDLVTLVTACALGLEPKLMHALVWHQSGGEPWAVAVPGEPMPRVDPSMRDAISETRAISAENTIRIGLAGLAINSAKLYAAMFLPCRNVWLAARLLEKLTVRCKTHPRLKSDPTSCAVAVYRGSWSQPDASFADAVMASVATGDAPNCDMPRIPASSSSTWHRRRRLGKTPLLLRPQRHLMIASVAGRAHCSPQEEGSSPARRSTPQVTVPVQANRSGTVHQMMIRRRRDGPSTVCLWRGRRCRGRNDQHRAPSREIAVHRAGNEEAAWGRPTDRIDAR